MNIDTNKRLVTIEEGETFFLAAHGQEYVVISESSEENKEVDLRIFHRTSEVSLSLTPLKKKPWKKGEDVYADIVLIKRNK